MTWFASLGWLLFVLGEVVAFWLVGSELSGGRETGIFIGCIYSGLALYVILWVYLGTTRVSVEAITDTTITLKRVSVRFARGVARMNERPGDAAGLETVSSAKPSL